MRIRKTISFKQNVFDKIIEERGEKQISTFVNDHFEEFYNIKEKKKKKKSTTI